MTANRRLMSCLGLDMGLFKKKKKTMENGKKKHLKKKKKLWQENPPKLAPKWE